MKRALVAISVLATGASAAWAADDARLLFAGDVLLAREVAREVELTRRSPWSGLAVFRKADFAMANFEGAVGDGDGCQGRSPCFQVRPGMLKMFADAGFRAAGVANNHAGDLGDAGREETKAALRQVGVTPLDFKDSPGFVRVKGRTVAVLAFNLVAGRDGRKDPVPSREAERKMRLARSLADWVVVSVHWGGELKDWPLETQQAMARWMISNGADVIVGHHPHVTTAPECVNGRPVFYSLGNHVFDQKYERTKEGMLADCRIAGSVLTCRPLTTRTPVGSSFPRLADEQQGEANLSNCRAPAGQGISVGDWHLRPWGEQNQLVTGPMVIEGRAAGKKGWKVAGRQVLSVGTGRLTATRAISLVTVERHPSSIDNEDGPRPYVYDVTDHGLVARWRGSALAWPLIDAHLVPGQDDRMLLCALHRADSFIQLDPETQATKTAIYQWNGFGFGAVEDKAALSRCEASFAE